MHLLNIEFEASVSQKLGICKSLCDSQLEMGNVPCSVGVCNAHLYTTKITFLTFELFWANLFSQYLSIRHQDDMTHHCILSQSEAQFTCALALSAENNVQV